MYTKTYKGRFRVVNATKYKGDITNIVYRSLWELKFMKWCDNNPAVLEWGSEEVVIPYLSPVDGRMHRYFVDFFVKIRDANGAIKRYLIEIKPKKFTEPPRRPAKQTPRYIQEVSSYVINQAKWERARAFCEERNWRFLVLTEKELGIDK